MARRPRVFVRVDPHYAVQREHDRNVVFVEADIPDREHDLIRAAVRRNQLTGGGGSSTR